MIGPKSHYMGFKDPTKNFIKYKLEWNPKYLKFYYNGRMVRKIDDAVIMEQLNNTTMNVVINNHVTQDVTYSEIPISNFVVKYFKYEKFN